MPHTRGPESQREMLSLVTARVRDAYVRKPFYVDGTLDLVSVCRELSAQGLTSALVNDGERLGIFTTTDLRDALLRETPPAQLAVREVARFGLIEVDADAELFEALWLMVRHRVHRLLVRDGGAVLGLLGQLDLVSFVANHSHIVAVQIDEAASIEELAAAARRVDALVELLHFGVLIPFLKEYQNLDHFSVCTRFQIAIIGKHPQQKSCHLFGAKLQCGCNGWESKYRIQQRRKGGSSACHPQSHAALSKRRARFHAKVVML